MSNFVELVRSPNPVDTLIYKRTILSRPRFFKDQREAEQYLKDLQAGKVKDEGLEEMFALRYLSPENFIFQEINALTNAWSKNARLKTFTGRGDGEWWIFTNGGVIATDATNGVYKTDGQDNPTFLAQHQFATEFLRFGMLDLDATTIQAEEGGGDGEAMSFTGRSYSGDRIEGTVRGVDGLISEIRYSMPEGRGPIRGRAISVSYKNGALQGVQVANIGKSASSPMPYCTYEVLEFKPQETSASAGCCGVKQFMNEADAHILVRADGQMFNLKKDPSVPLAQRPIPRQGFGGTGFKRAAVALMFAAVLLGPLALLFLRGNRRSPAKGE